MSRQILFNNATTVTFDASPSSGSLITSPDDVPEGRIMAFDVENFAAGPLDLSEKTSANKVIFVQGGKTGESPILTSVIDIKDVDRVFYKEYVAPVAQVSTVAAVNATSGIATLRVVEASAGFKPHRRHSVSVDLADYSNNDEVAVALRAELNKIRNRFFTASGSDAAVVITGDVGISFSTHVDGAASGWTVTATTAPNFGTGTGAQVKELEEIAWGQQANFLERVGLPVYPPQYASLTANYDLHTILSKTNTTRNIGGPGQTHQEITLAFYNEESPSSEFEAGINLDYFFGLADKPAEDESPSSSSSSDD